MQKIFSFLFALLLGTGTLMATEGAVFLPASGYRYRNTVTNHVLYEQTNTIEDQGYYWSTSFVDDWQASCVFFNGAEVRL